MHRGRRRTVTTTAPNAEGSDAGRLFDRAAGPRVHRGRLELSELGQSVRDAVRGADDQGQALPPAVPVRHVDRLYRTVSSAPARPQSDCAFRGGRVQALQIRARRRFTGRRGRAGRVGRRTRSGRSQGIANIGSKLTTTGDRVLAQSQLFFLSSETYKNKIS